MGIGAPVLLATSRTAEVQLGLLHRAATAADEAELDFIAVNDTHLLAPYRQSALWDARLGATRLSGVAVIELNAPYVQWLHTSCQRLQARCNGAALAVSEEDRETLLGPDWQEWIPGKVLWLPFAMSSAAGTDLRGGLLLARDAEWSEEKIAELAEWVSAWARLRHYAVLRKRRPGLAQAVLRTLRLRTRIALAAAGALALLVLVPVDLSVLAPAELVPANPMPVRAPLDGVVREFHVRPNEAVRASQPLFSLDTLQLGSRLDVAQQSLATAETELRQYDQQAMNDPKARATLAAARGNVAEKRTEVSLLRNQHGRATVSANEDGFALFDDPSQWVGRPVSTGERIMRLASARDLEIEAWIPIGDAIPLPDSAPLRLYLSASPLSPVAGTVYYVSHEATRRPDGSYAYRLRARLGASTPHRIGLKGTARVSGESVSMLYWIARRPLAAVREFLAL